MAIDETIFQIFVNLSLVLLFFCTLAYGALYSFSRFLSRAKGGSIIAFFGCIGLMIIVLGEVFQSPPPEVLTQFETTNWFVHQYLKAYHSQYVQYFITHLPKNSVQYYLSIYFFLGLLLLGYIRVSSTFTYKFGPFVQDELQRKLQEEKMDQTIKAKPLGGAPNPNDPRLAKLRSQQQQQEQLRAKLQKRASQ